MRKLLAKLLTFFIFPGTKRRNVRRFLIYFNFKDFFKYRNLKYKIIPIGTFCLPRWIATKMKIKAPRYYGEKTLPFDLCHHYDIDEITSNIKNNFKNYFDELEWSDEENTWVNKKFNAIYNHDDKLNKKKFILRYKKRINNFIEYCNFSGPVYFLFFVFIRDLETQEFIQKIQELNKVLSMKRGVKEYKLILVSLDREITLNKKIENLEIINQKWEFGSDWGKEMLETEYGKKFYNTLASKLLEKII